MTTQTVTAPTASLSQWDKNPPMVFAGKPITHIMGSWAVVLHAPRQKKLALEFCGNHQEIPLLPVGRTTGRALRHGRRELARLAIPVR